MNSPSGEVFCVGHGLTSRGDGYPLDCVILGQNLQVGDQQPQNLANRGRKGRDLANIFAGLLTCRYCGDNVIYNRGADSVSLLALGFIKNNYSCLPSSPCLD